jgi:GH15 family glucan-1,4-alpha-glucosidase
MPAKIEDYALIGDCEIAALVSRDGSIDWLCFPRFDSPACFAALLGTADNGRWRIKPAGRIRKLRRRYRDGTLILETDFVTDEGEVQLIDCMPPRTSAADVVRLVRGKRGKVSMRMELSIRFDYGSIVPWVRHARKGIRAIAGPDALYLCTDVETRGENFHTVAEFTVSEGEEVPFTLSWYPSHKPERPEKDAATSVAETAAWWRAWSDRCTYDGGWRDVVLRSFITLKALTYAPTGGIVAAATTSLPEKLGGVRNWDYCYCWLRDTTFTLYALMTGGYMAKARDWREWLIRAVAGKPDELQIIYGLAGERRLTELTLPWLPGYEGSVPGRIGNAASEQHQLDVYGEVMDALHLARDAGLEPSENAWRVQQAIMQFLETDWHRPDEGLWEVRGLADNSRIPIRTPARPVQRRRTAVGRIRPRNGTPGGQFSPGILARGVDQHGAAPVASWRPGRKATGPLTPGLWDYLIRQPFQGESSRCGRVNFEPIENACHAETTTPATPYPSPRKRPRLTRYPI